MTQNAIHRIKDHFAQIADPRVDRTKRYNLADMIVIALTAAICGAQTWIDVERFGNSKLAWFTKFLELPHGVPSHDTFGRVFARLDTPEFYSALASWIRSVCDTFNTMASKHVAIDGKVLRHSYDTATGQHPIQLVNAWSSDLRVCLGQVQVDPASNEIAAVPLLLELLELSGAVVTLDAMHCQTATAEKICERGADYILIVKGNQPNLRDAIAAEFDASAEEDFRTPGLRRVETRDDGHGRIETRRTFALPAPPALTKSGDWKHLKTIGMVYRQVQCQGKTSEEIVYFISSLSPRVKRLADCIRQHWGIENRLHWTMDVTFGEDDSRIRRGSGPAIAAGLRRLAASILQLDTTLKETIRGKRLLAGWNERILEQILSRFAGA